MASNTLKDLKAREKMYFDTYKTKRSNIEKAVHLEEMASIIREIIKLDK
jgi:hypothetical protein